MEHYYALIMAGGGGTRLWPMSRTNRPKQFLKLLHHERSMFRISVERIAPIFPAERIYVVTGEQYVAALRVDAPAIPAENFIIEPSGKNTAPAAGLGITVIQKRDREATVAILTADHYIADEDAFRDVLCAAYGGAQRGQIVTLGIAPTFPSTGFGYIQQGAALSKIDGYTSYVALGFTEKPNAVTATQFLASGRYSWNSGMFIWRAAQAMGEFERQQPALHNHLAALQPAVDTPQFAAKLRAIWEQFPGISIDYAIMENAQNMSVIPVDIGWNDIGSWDSLYDVLRLDKFGNCSMGIAPEPVMFDTRHTLAYSDRMVVTIGIEDTIIVDTEDVILVCHKDHAQQVREVVNHLRAAKREQYL